MTRGASLVANALVGGLLLCLLPTAGAGQRIHTYEVAPRGAMRDGGTRDTTTGAVGVFLASALLPGAGQFRLGAGRWVAYAAVETWAWVMWFDRRAEAADLEMAYQDLAWSVARRISQGRRRDREFEYYEAMSHFFESGSYDADAGTAGLQPEEDTLTFNGSVWDLARAIYYPSGADSVPTDPERLAALDYYQRRAIQPPYAWSWGSNQLEHEHFRALIRESDDAARAGSTLLGVILVNHVVSAIDALLTARLAGADGAPAPVRLRSKAMQGRGGFQPFVVLEIRTP